MTTSGLRRNPDVMAGPLAGAMRTHDVLARVEAGLLQTLREGAVWAGRPDGEHAARARGGARGSQSGRAV